MGYQNNHPGVEKPHLESERSEAASGDSGAGRVSWNRRQHHRFKPPRSVQSLLGEVVDLSVAGLRVFHKGAAVVDVGENFDLLMQISNREMLLPVRVIWIESMGFRRQMIGLELVNPSAEIQRMIGALTPSESTECRGPQCWVIPDRS